LKLVRYILQITFSPTIFIELHKNISPNAIISNHILLIYVLEQGFSAFSVSPTGKTAVGFRVPASYPTLYRIYNDPQA